MEVQNLNKSLEEIFQSKYIVPLYQRNYAWEEEEISQLLQDLYENFKRSKSNSELNYFIGSLVVLKRKDGFFEVIDGQQRLTTLSILLKILDLVKESKLFYESRPEVEAFFDSFYRSGNTKDVTFNYKVSHLVNAVDLLQQSTLNPDEKIEKRLFDIDDFDGFKKFIFNNVILVRVEIPQDTDVAAYFEIMNNRGEQLQKHEILKSNLMEKLKDEQGNYFKDQQDKFSEIWDACSQMDTHIQKLFSTEDRRSFFGNDYTGIISVNFNDEEAKKTAGFSINDALKTEKNKNVIPKIDDVDDSGKDSSIIDFPNFLMHIFKVKYQTYSDNGNETDIPLNEKDLISVFEGVKERVDPKDFINDLLYYRTVFDKYIIKSTEEENDEDKYRWSLQKPYKYLYSKSDGKINRSLKYENIFNKQERLIKSLSLLQVTFRNRKYKNWLQEILIFFSDRNKFTLSIKDYQTHIDSIILNYFEQNINEVSYDEGVKVPHFLFNFIDYLYYVKSPSSYNFKFTYRNSVEHHLPQYFNNPIQDNLGNLCLVSKSSNSKMNNESPVGKADASSTGKYYKNGNIPPKQKEMYDLTNRAGKWEDAEILEHRKQVIELLSSKKEILSF